MDSALPATTLTCSQCGGELHPDEGQIFLTCPYCSATVYVDKTRVVFHFSLNPTLDEEKARGQLFRWMAGNQTVKDLDKKARLVGAGFEYFPLWYIKYKSAGAEAVMLQPAAATSVTELRSLRLTAGDLVKYDAALDAQAVPPSVPLETALEWARERQPGDFSLLEASVVHIPLFTFKYVFQNTTYTALVEGATGVVLANIYPAKSEAPYLLAGGVTALVYLCLAFVPIVFNFSGGGSGIGVAICAGLGLLAAPFLFALAAWVASKV